MKVQINSNVYGESIEKVERDQIKKKRLIAVKFFFNLIKGEPNDRESPDKHI